MPFAGADLADAALPCAAFAKALTGALTDLPDLPGALRVRQNGREVEILANGRSDRLLEELRALQPEELECEALTLEEIFVATDLIKNKTTAK